MHELGDEVAVLDAHGLLRFIGKVTEIITWDGEVYYRVLYPGDQVGSLLPSYLVKTVQEAKDERCRIIRRYKEVAESVPAVQGRCNNGIYL